MCDPQLMQGGLDIGIGPRPKHSYLRANSRSSETATLAKDFGSPRLTLSEVNNFRLSVSSRDSSRRNSICRAQLVEDIQRLELELQQEMQLHSVLENAFQKKRVEISLPSGIPLHIQELLSSITALEACVSGLEEEVVSLQFQLCQERNERRLAGCRAKHSSLRASVCSPDDLMPQGSLSLNAVESSASDHYSSGDVMSQEPRDTCMGSTSNFREKAKIEGQIVSDVGCRSDKLTFAESHTDTRYCSSNVTADARWVRPKGFWNNPNQLSEEMVRCMKNIFISLSESSSPSKSTSFSENNSFPMSPHEHLSNLSSSYSEVSTVSSWSHSPQVNLQARSEVLAADDSRDPYKASGKLSWADIGKYALTIEVSWMSVTKKQLEYAAEALRRFRLLVEHLAKVDPFNMSTNEKLAFWINIYNALIMHAYLAYGVPKSELKLFTLMQKAAYTVGGQSISAAAIEYLVLKMKPPIYRPQIALLLALHKLKGSDEQRKFALDACEPLASFALSCGMYSSPAVRVYTSLKVKEELQEAHNDFVRASVGMSKKGKLLVPKMLYCFAKNYVVDGKLAAWISRYLPPHQAEFVEQCMSRRRKMLASWNCNILPFDSRFRYLFVPEQAISA